jgi:hypothetical protein
MSNLKALQQQLANIEANQHNLADPQTALFAKQREIIGALCDTVDRLVAAVGIDRTPYAPTAEATSAPALQPSTAPAPAPESTPSIATSDSEAPAAPVDPEQAPAQS